MSSLFAAAAAILVCTSAGVAAANAAETPVAPAATRLADAPSRQALPVEALDALAGGDGGVAVAVTNQDLNAVNTGNTINAGQVTTGDITLGSGALAGFSGVGNFLMNTGANNNLQSTMSVTVVMPPAEAAMARRRILWAALAAWAASLAPATAQIDLHGADTNASLHVMSWRDIPFRTVVRQQYDFSCGSAALATLLTYQYGRRTSEADAFKAMYATGDQGKIRKLGFSMYDMKKYLDAHGYRSDGFRMPLEELKREGLPAIALVTLGRYKHFVVVKGVAGGRVLVGDPALGLKIYSQPEFAKLWNGVAFVIDPGPASPKASFNVAAEWTPWARAPLGAGVDRIPLAELSRDLAPVYQLTPTFLAPGPPAMGGVP